MDPKEAMERFVDDNELGESTPCEVPGCPNNYLVYDLDQNEGICLVHLLERLGVGVSDQGKDGS